MKRVLMGLTALGFSTMVLAAPTLDEVKKNFEKNTKAPVESVAKTDIPGLYEIYSHGEIVYSNETGTLLVVGKLIDPAQKRSLTDERLSRLNMVDVSKLPVQQALKTVKGSGKRVMYTFEDPNCGYCKKLAKELVNLTDVTIYTFVMPILSEDSIAKGKKILCSDNPVAAWDAWMLKDKSPEGKTDCAAAAHAEANRELGAQLKVRGTPTVFFQDGYRLPGASSKETLEKRLNEAGAKK